MKNICAKEGMGEDMLLQLRLHEERFWVGGDIPGGLNLSRRRLCEYWAAAVRRETLNVCGG